MGATRVIIVDDNEINIDLARYLLEEASFEVEGLTDASRAVARIAESAPDIVLMDIQLPGVDGLQLTKELKADPGTRRIPIVAYTALAMRGDADRLRAAGCDGYIAKPICIATFAAEVRAVLEAATRAA